MEFFLQRYGCYTLGSSFTITWNVRISEGFTSTANLLANADLRKTGVGWKEKSLESEFCALFHCILCMSLRCKLAPSVSSCTEIIVMLENKSSRLTNTGFECGLDASSNWNKCSSRRRRVFPRHCSSERRLICGGRFRLRPCTCLGKKKSVSTQQFIPKPLN